MQNTYRPEIDGLRALAVLPVILYHAGIEIFKGGFVGVDIFFVISGYLITTIILKDIKKNKFSLAFFYQRRARRILPALIVTISLSLPFALFLLPPDDLKNFSNSIISSLTFWSNFQFAFETGYFETPGEYKPLLHTWSLSIEEQFYILYPLFLVLLFKINKKIVSTSLWVIFFLSLLFAQWSGNLNHTFPFIDEDLLFYSKSFMSTFMMPFGRIWELALGAICAITMNSNSYSVKINLLKNNKVLFLNIISFIGLFLICFSFFYLSKNFPYPSFYSLIPTIGTALLILFCNKNTIVQKILSLKFLVFIGLISYSAYLFHYPIFSFIKYTNININNNTYLYLIPIILFISFLNWKFIEKPFRGKNIPLSKLIKFIGFFYIILITLCLFIFANNGLDKREKFKLSKQIEKSFNAPKKGLECFNIEYMHKKENQKNICKLGKLNKKKIDFLIAGDSHMVAFYSVFDDLAKKHGKSGLFLGYAGCPPILNVYPLRGDQKEKNCYELNKLIPNIISEKNISNLILISRWTYYTDGNNFGKNINYLNLKPSRSSNKKISRIAFEKGLMNTLELYKKKKTNVFIIEQIPFQLADPKKIYYRSFDSNIEKFRKNLLKYSVDLNQHNNLQNFVKKIFKKVEKKYSNLTFINFNKTFCNDVVKKCLIGNEKNSFYSDTNHLSSKGAYLTKDKIDNLIKSF